MLLCLFKLLLKNMSSPSRYTFKSHWSESNHVFASKPVTSKEIRATGIALGQLHSDPFIYFFFFLAILEPRPGNIEVPRLEVETEWWPPAYTTATQDPSRICNLHHSSWQHQILNLQMEARDRTCILVDPSQAH